MKAFTIHCTKHEEFCPTCSACWIALQTYSRANGIDTEVRNLLNFATQLDKVPWRPYMTVGYIKTGPSGGKHNLGWSLELFEERLVEYNSYYGINQAQKELV